MKKEIRELNNKEIKSYRLLGKACSESFNHCVYMGQKHKEGFMKRVTGYRQVENDRAGEMLQEKIGKKMITIEFYEKRDTSKRDELIREGLKNAKEEDRKHGKLIGVEITNDIMTKYREKDGIVTKQVSKVWQEDDNLDKN